jgi:O-antigen/teichoic acid export membrane protein
MIKKVKSFLFENKTDKQTIMKNTFWLMLAEGISKWGIFFITVLIARILWPEQFWVLNFVMSFVAMFIVITDFGLTTLMVREVSRDHSKVNAYLVNLSFLKIVLWIITFLIVWIVSQFIWKDDLYITLILIYCWYSIVFNFGEFVRAIFRPSEMMQYEALLKIINGVLMLVIVLYALYTYWDLVSIMYGYLISGVLSLVVSLIYVGRKFEIGNVRLDKEVLRSSLKSGVYLWLGIFFISLYISIDQVILWLYNQIEALWVYWLAYKFTMIYWLITWIIFLNIFPSINKKKYDLNLKNNYINWIKKIFKFNFFFFIFIEILIYIIFNNFSIFPEYKNLYTILSILIIYYIFEPLWYWWYINIVSLKKDKINLIFLFITSIFNIISNIILIPKYSYYWAAFSTIFSYIIFFILTFVYLNKFYNTK